MFKTVELVSDRMFCIVLRGHKFDTTVVNAYTPAENTSDRPNSKNSFYEELYHFLQYHMKIRLGNFSTELGQEDIFQIVFVNAS